MATKPSPILLFRMAEIEFKQKSNRIRSCNDGCGILDCKWGLIWFPDQFTFLFHSKLSFQYIFQGTQNSQIFSFQFMVCQQNNEILSGDGQNKFLSLARSDFSSLQFFRIPAVLISNKLICSPSGGAMFFRCTSFQTRPIWFGR